MLVTACNALAVNVTVMLSWVMFAQQRLPLYQQCTGICVICTAMNTPFLMVIANNASGTKHELRLFA